MTAGQPGLPLVPGPVPSGHRALGLVEPDPFRVGTLTHLVNGLDKALPPGASKVFTQAVRMRRRTNLRRTDRPDPRHRDGLWSASGGMVALETGLDMAYEVPVDRKFVPSGCSRSC